MPIFGNKYGVLGMHTNTLDFKLQNFWTYLGRNTIGKIEKNRSLLVFLATGKQGGICGVDFAVKKKEPLQPKKQSYHFVVFRRIQS